LPAEEVARPRRLLPEEVAEEVAADFRCPRRLQPISAEEVAPRRLQPISAAAEEVAAEEVAVAGGCRGGCSRFQREGEIGVKIVADSGLGHGLLISWGDLAPRHPRIAASARNGELEEDSWARGSLAPMG
jgi:hypothetical protein